MMPVSLCFPISRSQVVGLVFGYELQVPVLGGKTRALSTSPAASAIPELPVMLIMN